MKDRIRLSFAFFAAFTLLIYSWGLVSCGDRNDVEPHLVVDMSLLPLPNLSDYGFFKGTLADLEPHSSVIPYDLNTPLFSDYSRKARYIYMPEGVSAGYDDDSVLVFPLGTIIIKTFYYDNDFRDPSLGRYIIETRLLVKTVDAWEPYSYLWNELQTEATFSVVGGPVDISWTHFDGSQRSTSYLIPNKNECKGCHEPDETNVIPLGPKARNLNRDFAYSDGTMNQLEKLIAVGYLTGMPTLSTVPKVPVWNDPTSGSLDLRTRGYLDVNCGHCHNPNGPANSSGLFLHWEETNNFALGICKPPIAAGQGSGNNFYDIVPGNPDASIMPDRMNSVVPDVAMPELGRSVIHEEGVQLIRDWIAAMDSTGC